MRFWILAIGIVAFALAGCEGRQSLVEKSLQEKQTQSIKFYEGQKVLARGLDDFRAKFGRWPRDFDDLYQAGLLPSSYTYFTESGRQEQRIQRDFAVIEVLQKSPRSLRYRLWILGDEFEEVTMETEGR